MIPNQKDLLEAGVHLGHMTSRWNAKMSTYIFMEHQGIHIIDLRQTAKLLDEALKAIKGIACSGRRILFLGTKRQARSIVALEAHAMGMPYVTERWIGGSLTNFSTMRKLIKKMMSLEKKIQDPAYKNITKKEQLMIAREKTKLNRLLSGLVDMTRLPAALFVVDIKKERIGVREAQILGIPVFALVDTNVDPTGITYPIPSNDDSVSSIALIIKSVRSAVEEGIEERNKNKTEQGESATEGAKKRGVQKVEIKEVIEKTKQSPRGRILVKNKPTAKQNSKSVSEKPASRANRDISIAKSEKPASKANRDISITKDEKPASRAKEGISITKLEKPAAKAKEDISIAKDEKPAAKAKEDISIAKSEKPASRANRDISIAKDEKPASRAKEDISIAKDEKVKSVLKPKESVLKPKKSVLKPKKSTESQNDSTS